MYERVKRASGIIPTRCHTQGTECVENHALYHIQAYYDFIKHFNLHVKKWGERTPPSILCVSRKGLTGVVNPYIVFNVSGSLGDRLSLEEACRIPKGRECASLQGRRFAFDHSL